MAKSKKDQLKEAHAHLARAKDQFDCAVDSWEPADPAECVTKCFYAYENGLVAAATALGAAWTKKHYEKVALAKQLFEQNKLKTELNELRKDVSYGDPGEDLSLVDLEGLVSDLELFLGEVDELVTNMEKD
ncbi:MAG TPA: hypothetical protein VI386_38630 [Candidatus Sulfotelmatobacter sp.]